MTQLITKEIIEAGIPQEYRYIFSIHAFQLPAACMPVIESFWKAVALMLRVINPHRKFIHVIFGTAPFEIILSDFGKLTFIPENHLINSTIENMIFLDINKMLKYPEEEIRIASILEELIHTLANILDEELSHQMVALVYDKILYQNGQFRIKEAV